MSNEWQLGEIDNQLLELALLEDLGYPFIDVTTDTLFKGKKQSYSIKIISKSDEDIVVAGLPIVKAILSRFDAEHELITSFQDGDTQSIRFIQR